jgi:phosphoenolpyruvate-protein phosphotransferase/dihydroxyacetone kinase phosphotransfer subunit
VVGIVVVSHSASVAEGVVELARQMGGEELRLEAAGGLEDGSLGTDVERIRAAIERAMSPDGVLVLMDLGSALMSTEMAIELLEPAERVEMSEAPIVEGTVAAAVAARAGATIEEVRAEASRAIAMKEAPLGVKRAEADDPSDAEGRLTARIPVLNAIGLHARPAALVAELAGRFDVDLRLAKEGGERQVDARSLTGLMGLLARKGDVLVASATGPQASEALDAMKRLANEGFGEEVEPRSAVPVPAAAPEGPVAAPARGALLRGIAGSPGIALGPARLRQAQPEPSPQRASKGLEAESRRLESAIQTAREEIERDRDEVARRSGAADAAIFNAHLALLEDEALLSAARSGIESGEAAETAWSNATRRTADSWRKLDDELMRERAADVDDVGTRVVAAITGRESGPAVQHAGVFVVDELSPAEVARIDVRRVRGIAAARGSATAHGAILARALGIPAAVGLGAQILAVADGTELLLDGAAGTVLVEPEEDIARQARRTHQHDVARREEARRHAAEPAVTRDGVRIEVSANLGGAGGAAEAVALGADGVGLLRTEFLFLDRPEIPSEDEQTEAIAEIARALEGRPLIVRTLDAGADKPLPALPMPAEHNPFLGCRGIRLSLEHPELLETQLRAVLRVAAEHPVKVMFPMVATVAEVEAARSALARARSATGIDAALEVGIMIEVPSAALQARQLAARVDFFSIGTNDLTQYTMAAERGNERVGDLLGGPQPAVLRLVREAVEGASSAGRWVGVCGELAGDPAAAVLMVGLGVRELSMAPPLVAEVKQALRSVTLADAAAAAKRALSASDAAEAWRCAADLI